MKIKSLNILDGVGEVDVVYKFKKSDSQLPTVRSSSDAMKVMEQVFKADKMGLQEQFVAVFLNRSNKVIGSAHLFSGGVTSTLVDIRIVVATALKLLTSAVIVAHNHPSGNLTQSEEDTRITRRLKEALELMDIKLLDHLIVGPNNDYFSFADTGNL